MQRVRRFIYEDIQKTLDISNSNKGVPNFLLVLSLCCYTEYWGKLSLGNPEDGSRKVFNAFFKRLGAKYKDLVNNSCIHVYGDIRGGLARAYLIEGRNIAINIGYDPSGIDYDQELDRVIFYVSSYFEDLKNAVDKYVNGLESGTEDLTKLEHALKGRAELI